MSFLTLGTKNAAMGNAIQKAVIQFATQIKNKPSINPKFLKVITKDMMADMNRAIKKEKRVL